MICTEATTRMVGQQSVFTATFTNDAGAPVDPATVTFKFAAEATLAERLAAVATIDISQEAI